MIVNKGRNMKPALAVKINYLIGSMMIEYVRHLGPISDDDDTRVSQAYFKLNLIRQEISNNLMDYLDAQEESTV
jgi:hypothetical protein